MGDLFLKIIEGDVLDALKTIPDESVNLIVTSPPYWGLRDYGVEGQIGLEPTLDEYLDKMLKVTAELKRVLRKDGVMFWNHGDNYSTTPPGNKIENYEKWSKTGDGLIGRLAKRNSYGSAVKKTKIPRKSLCLQNYRLAIRMIDEQGWILRNIVCWYKRNHLPSSVKDRFTNAYEPVFFFVKSKKYWSDLDAVREPHKETSIERAKRGVSSNHKYANLPHYGGGGGINKPRPNIKHDIAVGRIGNFSYDDPLHSRPLHPLGKNPGDMWDIPTQPFSAKKLGIEDVDHYAVFPEELVRRIIKFGCPQWICKKCGKPRVRIVERYTINAQDKRPDRGQIGSHPQKQRGGDSVIYTVGWTDCGCNAGWRPGVVLDPFMGSGTTLKVARELGRSAIGIELNPDYVRIAKKRVNWGVGLDVEFIYEEVKGRKDM